MCEPIVEAPVPQVAEQFSAPFLAVPTVEVESVGSTWELFREDLWTDCARPRS